MKTTQNLLSKLWMFLVVNYIFCDVFSLYHAEFLKELLTGKIDGIEFTEPFLLSFAIIMEMPMLMILLSSTIAPKINRIINIFAGVLMLVIQIGSLLTGKNTLHYVFFSFIEISTLLFIIYTAWQWSNQRDFKNRKRKFE